ncbi:GIY-YIG nuclease family protein [Chelatococcus sp.]|uniref:GIY-YIG nuclease family protein n=1 Tax=Chelatococcus sp. TaxID=1953771 RepID=UPI00343E5E40
MGVTSDLLRRVEQHRAAAVPGFTQKYGVFHLVYFERFRDISEAIAREKQLKGWKRTWKIRLIERSNPEWHDLTQRLRRRIAWIAMLLRRSGSPSRRAAQQPGKGIHLSDGSKSLCEAP